ncbi:MAG: AEC family transporter [Candidatus Thermoplasmatota archaeon]|nr:AEC family transporter [Candidatus Thermoplasmatota archaeon]
MLICVTHPQESDGLHQVVNVMNVFLITLESVAVLLGIGIIGFFIIRQKILPTTVLSALTPLALDIALPSLIFVDIFTDFTPEVYPLWWQYPLWWVFFTMIAFFFTFLFSFLSRKQIRNEFRLSLFYQNGIFFPLALFAGMFPGESRYVVILFLFTIFYPAFFFSTYHFFFKSSKMKQEKIPLKKIIHPALLATIIAILIGLFHLNDFFPDFMVSILSLLGGMTVPLLMIILGGNIYINYKKNGLSNFKDTILFTLVKNLFFPLCFLPILYVLKSFVSSEILFILFLQSAVPPITATPVVVKRLGGNDGIAGQFVVSSFIFSLVSLPVMIVFYDLIIGL